MQEVYRVTGLMSGSSLDGVDLAYCEFRRENGSWEYQIIEAATTPYPGELRESLQQASGWEAGRIHELDLELGRYYAGLIREFHTLNGFVPELVSSHGHTIRHRPDLGITLQAGDGPTIARLTGLKVVNDFRSENVTIGGQGAPLVPAGDRLLFGDYGACVNLGGIANISYEAPRGRRIAFDTGPANLAMNWIAGLRGQAYDRNGIMAGKGRIAPELLNLLNGLDYYHRLPPKSLGKEWFEDSFLPLLSSSPLEPEDQMATVVENIAMQVAGAIGRSGAQSVLVTGGGALNRSLILRVKHHTVARLTIPEIRLVKFKEAMVFALLGVLRILGEVNCLASATGAPYDLSAGTIHQP